jgi:hypothetical protein
VSRGCERCGLTDLSLRPLWVWRGPGGKWTVCDECADFLRAYRIAVAKGPQALAEWLAAQPKVARNQHQRRMR